MTNGGPVQPAAPAAHRLFHVAEVLLAEPFTVRDVGRLRGRCQQCVLDAGFAREQSLMMAVAINEAMLDTIQHGGGRGVLTLLCDGGGRMVAEVAGSGGDGRLSEMTRAVDEVSRHLSDDGTTLRMVMTGAPVKRGPHDSG